MKIFISFITYFILIYLCYFFTVIIQKGKENKYKNGKQIRIFIKKYNLDFNKIPYKKFIQIISITNSLIMAITITIIMFIPNLILKLVIAVPVLVVLILLSYSLIGFYIERRNKNV